MNLPVIEAEQFRAVMANYPTGAVIVTGISANSEPVGMVVGSFTSISLEPCLVGYFPSKTSASYGALADCTDIAVNVLSSEQVAVCQRFASKSCTDKFKDLRWAGGRNGAPLIDGALAWVECSVGQRLDLGDHFLVVAEPTHISTGDMGNPLVFYRGGYGQFAGLEAKVTRLDTTAGVGR